MMMDSITSSYIPILIMSSGNVIEPLEVGTRGTIGSLVKREIDYFRKLEPDQRSSEEMASSSSSGGRRSWPSFKFSMSSWIRKKRRNSGIRPGMCSMVDVVSNDNLNEFPSFAYLNLRADSERFHL